jgi:hypothetical protein
VTSPNLEPVQYLPLVISGESAQAPAAMLEKR